ncbi:PAS domain-containing protein [Ferrovibrio sp.]|uniref:PAS domain-containing protein n=1 Tax=Ferrovibrio sp. TaxID=1917215 RepID=UPI0025B990AF|nr:PAS domain-containing protein [Ferrovibrio sp.]MBX3453832.1 PAS domain-containing protein [Ferrovibrio sp.]
MSIGDGKSAALVARLAEEDESLLDNRSPIAEGMLIERLYQYSIPSRHIPYMVLFGACALFFPYTNWFEIIALTVAYTAGTAWLDRQRKGFAEDDSRLENSVFWANRFAIGSAITGTTWGVMFWLFGVEGNHELQAALAVAWSGLSLANLNTRAPHLVSYYAFQLPMSLLLLARGLVIADRATYFMLLFGFVLTVALARRAHVANHNERLAIALRLRNAELVAGMDKARAEASNSLVQTEQLLAARMMRSNVAERLAGTGSWMWHLNDDAQTWSDNMFRLLGLSPVNAPAELPVLLDACHPDDRANVQAYFDRMREKGEAPALTFRIARGKDAWHSLRLSGEAKRDTTGMPYLLTGLLQSLPQETAQPAE